MKRTIQINTSQLNSEFEDLMDEMYLKYHYHQTNIPKSIKHNDRDREGDWGRLGNSGNHWVNGMPPGMKQ